VTGILNGAGNAEGGGKEITRAKKKFIACFIANDFRNATGAYLKAYPKASYDTARANAAKLLANACVQEYLSSVIAEALRRDKIPLEKRIFDYWMKRAFYDITELIDLHGNVKLTEEELREKGLEVCIDSINQKASAQGETVVTYKFADKDRAAEMLQKYIQMIHEKIEVNLREDDRLIDLKNLLLGLAKESPGEMDRIIDGLEKLTGDAE
jgi:phage terminase small subunit